MPAWGGGGTCRAVVVFPRFLIESHLWVIWDELLLDSEDQSQGRVGPVAIAGQCSLFPIPLSAHLGRLRASICGSGKSSLSVMAPSSECVVTHPVRVVKDVL